MPESLETVQAELREVCSIINRVGQALLESPERLIFANGGAYARSIDPLISPISVSAKDWPTVEQINKLLVRFDQARTHGRR